MNKRLSIRGFTLVELLIALVIMALGFVSLQRLYTATMRDNIYALHLNEAVNAARSRLERMIAGNYEMVQSGTETAGRYLLTWSVSEDDPVVRCKTISVTAEWREWGHMERTSLQRILCE